MKDETRQDILHSYLVLMATRSIFTPYESLEDACQQLDVDMKIILALQETRYLQGRDHRVPKAGNMHLAWEFAQNPADHHRFAQMLRVSPLVFQTILTLIEDHPVFRNDSNNAQAPVEVQLAVIAETCNVFTVCSNKSTDT